MSPFEPAAFTLPDLETPRFVLRDMRTAGDAELATFFNADDHAYLRNGPIEVESYPTVTPEQARQVADYFPFGSNMFIYPKSADGSTLPIGKFTLFGRDKDKVRIAPFILPSARGEGAITEAYEGLLHGLHIHGGINSVYLEVLTDNRPMNRVMEKLGATPLGIAPPLARNDFTPEGLLVNRYEIDLTKVRPVTHAAAVRAPAATSDRHAVNPGRH